MNKEAIPMVDTVLEDVIARLIEESGIEITVLNWAILENVRDSCQNPGENPPE
jgi:hypothetical protein